MSGIELSYNITSRPIQQQLNKLSAVELRDVTDAIGSSLASAVESHFNRQETWNGSPFIRSARAIADGGQTLIDTHALVDGHTYNLIGDDSVEIGSNIPYAAIHHFGGMTGRKHKTKIQPNPVLGINADDEREIDALIMDKYREALR